MKKVILLLLLIAGMQQLKAQQVWQAKPGLKLSDSVSNYFKPKTYNSLQRLLKQPDLNGIKLPQTNLNNEGADSRMPIVKLNATDHMPVARLEEPGIKYTMLIKRIPAEAPAPVVLPRTAP